MNYAGVTDVDAFELFDPASGEVVEIWSKNRAEHQAERTGHLVVLKPCLLDVASAGSVEAVS